LIQRRTLLGAGLAAPALAALLGAWNPALAADAATPPTLDELLRRPEVLGAALSPDGDSIAILREQKQGDKRSAFILVVKVADLAAQPHTIVLGDLEVSAVFWANNQRLLVSVIFEKAPNGSATGYFDGSVFVVSPIRRTMAIGIDGSNPIIMFINRASNLIEEMDLGLVVDLLVDDPDHVLMQIWDMGHNVWTLQKVDVNTGVGVIFEKGVKATDYWYCQNGQPVMRFDSNVMDTVLSVYVRAPNDDKWVFYRKIRAKTKDVPPEFQVVGVTPEPGVLLALDWPDGEDGYVLRRFNIADKTMGEILARQPGRDIDDLVTDRRGQLVGAQYADDRVNYQFVDKAWGPHFKGMNAFFENQCNVVLEMVNDDHTRCVARVTGPRQPAAYYFYDRKAARFDLLGESQSWLNGRLATMETLKVKARDGLELTAYLSTPITPAPAGGARPMVVMPHGGPQLRDSYDYDVWAQALAAQGWLVLQPNFRGTGGLGRALAEAGHHHWGDAMQWDVEDCVDSLVKAGRADPAKLAILGGSYGGYAAMMGPILKPDLYRCAVSRAGPSDLLADLADTRRDAGADSELYDWWTTLMGDPAQDGAMLRAASPAQRAAEFKIPLLLYHGTKDRIVEVAASRGMESAMKAAGKSVTYVEVKGEGHSGWKPEHEKDFLTQSIAFIAKAFKA
jgi:pimeloyl-ACP methyl ester carboxylesterase